MKKGFAALLVGAMALTTVGCSSGSGGGSQSKDNTFTVGINQELSGVFSPLYYQSSYDGDVINLVYQSLLKYDVNSELQPELAAEMPTVSEDGLTYTFKLKEGVTFSDGTPLTSSDVKYTFTVIADPTYSGRMTANAENIVGYEEYHSGDATELTGIETPDDTTVIFHIKEPQIDAINNFGGMSICSDEQFEYTKGNTEEIESNTDKPIGSGPYVLNKYDKATGASLVKNEKFTGEGDYAVENIIIKKTDAATEYDELANGTVDLLPGQIEQNKIGPASLNDSLTYNAYTRAGVGFVGFNAAEGSTADVAVRQALAYATDRQTFVENFYAFDEASDEMKEQVLGYVPQAYWNPASTTMGAYVRGEQEVKGLVEYTYDLDKANQILDDAGWVKGSDGIRSKDGERLVVKFMASAENSVLDTLLPMVQKSWKEIGVDVQTTTLDFNTVLSTLTDDSKLGEWSCFFLATGYTGVADTDANLNYGSDQDGKPYSDNYSRVVDEELNGYLNAGYKTADAKVSEEAYLKAMIRANELVPYLPLYGNQYFDLYNTRVKGLETGPVHTWSLAMDKVTLE
ncbi:MAG: ABC transporter substrate-binding protein [Clostridium sp.]